MKLKITYHPPEPQPEPQKLKLAYIKHQPLRIGFPLEFYPDTCTMQDRGQGTIKGRTIPIRARWWRYIERINNPLGYEYARSIDAMWINIHYDNEIPYSTGRAESIDCGGNFIEWDIETPTHVRRVDYPNNFDADTLDPRYDNWFFKPHRFWKACAVNADGRVINVHRKGQPVDVYIPRIRNEPLNGLEGCWIEKKKLVFLPEDYYTFRGGSVYKDGQLFFETTVVKPA